VTGAAPVNPLRLIVATVPGVTYSAERCPLRAKFENQGASDVRLLDHFEPLPVFFAFELTRADGTPVAIPGGGKIDFAEGQVGCVTIPPDGSLSVELDLSPWLRNAELPPGTYRLGATYHNQYGDGCFQGQLKSGPIELTIGGTSA